MFASAHRAWELLPPSTQARAGQMRMRMTEEVRCIPIARMWKGMQWGRGGGDGRGAGGGKGSDAGPRLAHARPLPPPPGAGDAAGRAAGGGGVNPPAVSSFLD